MDSSTGLWHPCPLPPERQFSVPDLRRLEIERTAALPVAPPLQSDSAPRSGDARSAWLRTRLVRLLQDDMDTCLVAHGVKSMDILEAFERLTGESFSPSLVVY